MRQLFPAVKDFSSVPAQDGCVDALVDDRLRARFEATLAAATYASRSGSGSDRRVGYSKRMWVYRRLAEKDLLLSSRPVKEFVTGEGFDYLGRSYRLLLADCDTVRLERGRMMMPRQEVRSGEAAAALIHWYRSRGQEWLLRRMKPWARRMAVEAAGLDIRDLGYRWGSLSKNGRLNIHWATLQLSPWLIDYVLVHELAHIKHPQHTPAFWAAVERAVPDYERRKTDLTVVGAKLWLG